MQHSIVSRDRLSWLGFTFRTHTSKALASKLPFFFLIFMISEISYVKALTWSAQHASHRDHAVRLERSFTRKGVNMSYTSKIKSGCVGSSRGVFTV